MCSVKGCTLWALLSLFSHPRGPRGAPQVGPVPLPHTGHLLRVGPSRSVPAVPAGGLRPRRRRQAHCVVGAGVVVLRKVHKGDVEQQQPWRRTEGPGFRTCFRTRTSSGVLEPYRGSAPLRWPPPASSAASCTHLWTREPGGDERSPAEPCTPATPTHRSEWGPGPGPCGD